MKGIFLPSLTHNNSNTSSDDQKALANFISKKIDHNMNEIIYVMKTCYMKISTTIDRQFV